MKRKRVLAAGLALMLMFAFVAPTFASMEIKNFDGRAYRTFNTETVTRDLESGWSSFTCKITSVSYTFPNFTYCYGRAMSSDGNALSPRLKVQQGFTTPFYVYDSVNDPAHPNLNKVAYFRIYNADYKEFGHTDNEMHAVGFAKFIYD